MGFIGAVVGAIILLIAGFIVAGVIERWVASVMRRVRGFDETLYAFGSSEAWRCFSGSARSVRTSRANSHTA
jgi:hypothetical protein